MTVLLYSNINLPNHSSVAIRHFFKIVLFTPVYNFLHPTYHSVEPTAKQKTYHLHSAFRIEKWQKDVAGTNDHEEIKNSIPIKNRCASTDSPTAATKINGRGEN